MSTVLCFTIRFLDPQPGFHGRTDGEQAEWPPSPLRLFQAIIDGAGSRWRASQFDSCAKVVLERLEQLAPPTIIGPTNYVGAPVRIAVPNNDLDVWARPFSKGLEPKKQPNELKTMKTVRPTYLLGGDAVHYLFPLPDDVCPYLEGLQLAAHSITHLGWGIDMVAADAAVITEEEAAKLPGDRWHPVLTGGTPLRVPVSGTLEALVEKHNAFLYRLGPDGFHPVPPLTVFRVVGYRRDRDPVGRPYAAFRFLHSETGKNQTYAATDPVKVAGMIRGAAGKVALNSLDPSRPREWIDEFVYGHHEGPESFPRFSYLSLPSIQPVVGIGRIGRVLIAEPTGTAGEQIQWIRRLLAGHVALGAQGRHALLIPLTEDRVLDNYVTSSACWTTVTPVALPGSDDGLTSKTDKLLEKMFRHAGYSLDAVAELDFHRTPFLRGAEDAKQYRPRAPHYLAHCTMYHMRIRWKFPMPGPIALGAGRHCGLGVFAAIS